MASHFDRTFPANRRGGKDKKQAIDELLPVGCEVFGFIITGFCLFLFYFEPPLAEPNLYSEHECAKLYTSISSFIFFDYLLS